MNSLYNKRKDENLSQWVDHIAAACKEMSVEDVKETILEVSKQSYLAGVHAERELHKTFPLCQ